MAYGTPPTVEEVIATHKRGDTDYTVGWKGMLDILVAEVERLSHPLVCDMHNAAFVPGIVGLVCPKCREAISTSN